MSELQQIAEEVRKLETCPDYAYQYVIAHNKAIERIAELEEAHRELFLLIQEHGAEHIRAHAKQIAKIMVSVTDKGKWIPPKIPSERNSREYGEKEWTR